MSSARPLIVGIGGAARPNSSSECPLKTSLRAAENAGAETVLVSGRKLRKHAQIPPAVPHEGELETASDICDRGGWT
jgi:FMN reductase